MRATLIALAVLVLASCVSQPLGQYSAAQVQQGLKDAVSRGHLQAGQAAEVANDIASAETGIQWGEIAGAVGSVVASLGLGYLGLRTANNKHIIGEEEADVLTELVQSRRKSTA